MQAWQIQDDHTIKLASMTTPEPGPDQVRVKVRAMGVNRADILQVKGLYPAPPGFDSSVPGLEYAGEIEAVGSQVMGRKVGDRVMGLIPGCAYSEYLVTHERETLTLPDEIDFATGATIPEAFLTAYRAMFLAGGLQPGQYHSPRGTRSSGGSAHARCQPPLQPSQSTIWLPRRLEPEPHARHVVASVVVHPPRLTPKFSRPAGISSYTRLGGGGLSW